ncbi:MULTISPECIES: helix-turn-helix transcriptional regulator [unclassified Nonomuraea]|uniref:helix-turn-helix domain-containing protein n=1 Tax=unclassified Nonomuraea TaxID=2593643 RepID=UPI0033ECD450
MSVSELDPDAGPLAWFGYELRKFRIDKGLTIDQLANRVGFSPSLVGSVERAARNPSKDFTERCEEALGLSGELLARWPSISRERSPKWFRPWLEIEQSATALRTWEPLIVPGLLQTTDYARAIFTGKPGTTPEQVEEALAARMERQAILARSKPPMFWAVLDEGILYRPVGGETVTRLQLEHLIVLAESTRITIQVLPYSALSTTGLLGGFMLAKVNGMPEAAYLESAGQGQVRDAPDEVAALSVRYDAICAEALPQHVSLKVIKERLVTAWS